MTEYLRKWYNKIKKLHDGGGVYEIENGKENRPSKQTGKKDQKNRRFKMEQGLMQYKFKGTSENVIVDALAKCGSIYDNFQIIYDNKSELITVIFVQTTNLHGFIFFCEDSWTTIPLTGLKG